MYPACCKKAFGKGKSAVIKKDTYLGNRTYALLFFVLFGLIFSRYCYYGFEYYHQLDDYIQYHNYTAYNDDLWKLIKSLGMLSSRPLAGLFDLFVWSNFYGAMIIAVGIISAMYAASAIFLHKVFSKHFGTGYMFFIIYALLPLGFEGIYWVSASSRIVVGLFFASMSLLFFDEWCDGGKKSRLVLFAVFQFIAFCFYEQIVLFSGAATLIVMICYANKRSRQRAIWGFLMFANAALYLAFTQLAPSGVYGERTALFLPWQDGYVEQGFLSACWQMICVFISGGAATCGKGLLRGFKLLIEEPNFIYVLAILALCSVLFVTVRKERRENISFFAELFTGVFLAIAPLLLFFVLKNPWFSARNAVPSFCGLALVGDALFDLIFGRLKKSNVIEAALVSAAALLCCTASISEIHDYRETTAADVKIASAASEALENTGFESGESIWLLNVDASYVSDANFYFHEHGYGVTSSDWALTGALRAVSGRGDLPLVTPVSVHRHFPVEKKEIEKARILFYTGDGVVPVSLEKSETSTWEIKSGSGKLFGTLIYSDGGLTLKTK